MRSSHVVTALAVVTAGLTAAATLRRLGDRHLTAPADVLPTVEPLRDRDAVVLPFTRPVAPAADAEQPAAPRRCGDSGGRTKAGAPCGARATTGGRCHHHPLAA